MIIYTRRGDLGARRQRRASSCFCRNIHPTSIRSSRSSPQNPAAKCQSASYEAVSQACARNLPISERYHCARSATTRANSTAARTRQHVTASPVIKTHKVGLDGVLTEQHRHRIVDSCRLPFAHDPANNPECAWVQEADEHRREEVARSGQGPPDHRTRGPGELQDLGGGGRDGCARGGRAGNGASGRHTGRAGLSPNGHPGKTPSANGGLGAVVRA